MWGDDRFLSFPVEILNGWVASWGRYLHEGVMMNSPRRPVLMRTYAVECIWPFDPSRYREAVRGVPEETARNSAKALMGMRYAFRVKVLFFLATPERTPVGEVVAAQWDREGNMIYTHRGKFQGKFPEWLTHNSSLALEVFSESIPAGS